MPVLQIDRAAKRGLIIAAAALAFAVVFRARSLPAAEPADSLRKLDPRVLPADAKPEQMLHRDIWGRVHAANLREAQAFAAVRTPEDWNTYRAERLQRLRAAVGEFPERCELNFEVVKTVPGDGFAIDNVVFQSRPGLWVPANLYRPAAGPATPMPAFILVHSFLHPRTQGELQDMGMTWAKAGCVVLVPDVLNHGERRQHPFTAATKRAEPFPLGRQDYYFRFNTGLQLSLAGESLVGWMAYDVSRCVDLLVARKDVDPKRIVVLGSVAGGGDIAAIAAALDERIAAVAPFNFGGPEPETGHPLPADAERVFPYAQGHWDPTRRLPRSAIDGLQPWVICGLVAPRPLMYGHEFAWDRERDPAWPRLQRMYELAGAVDKVAPVFGRGSLQKETAADTGCANIHPDHRKQMYPLLQRWLGIEPPKEEVRARRKAEDLATEDVEFGHRAAGRVHREAELQYRRRADAVHRSREIAGIGVDAPELLQRELIAEWPARMGPVSPAEPRAVVKREMLGGIVVERIVLAVERDIVVPMLLLVPAGAVQGKTTVVIAVAQHGKAEFLKQRAEAIAMLLAGGVAVCLADLRGTGETTAAGDLRGPGAGRYKAVESNSAGTLLACGERMLGGTLIGARVRDLRGAVRYMSGHHPLRAKRVLLWGDSFAPVNEINSDIRTPWDGKTMPHRSEPTGAIVVLGAALLESELVDSPVAAVHAGGGPASWRHLCDDAFVWTPADAIVPDAAAGFDVPQWATAIRARVRLDAVVDGCNVRVAPNRARELFPRRLGERVEFGDGSSASAQWLLKWK